MPQGSLREAPCGFREPRERASPTESSAKLSFGLLDESGKLVSAPIVLAQGLYLAAGSIASIGDHFVVSYALYQSQESGVVSRLLVLGSDGNALGPPIAFENSSSSGFGPAAPSLLVRGNRVLAAWSTLSGSLETEDAATTIRVARFDANGARQGPTYDLQTPAKDREAVQPLWIEMGGDVGFRRSFITPRVKGRQVRFDA